MPRVWIFSFTAGLMALPFVTFAAEGFVPLIGLPGITDSANSTQAYFDAIYKFSIVAAAFLAVVKIIFAGVQYMITDLVNSKEQAKKDIRGALLGLLIVLGAVLILNTINPNLTEFTLFKDVPTPIDVRVFDDDNDSCSDNETLVKVAGGEEKCVSKAVERDVKEGVSVTKLVVEITEEEHVAAANNRKVSELIEQKQTKAAEICDVEFEKIIVKESAGFQGYRFYCP